MVEGFSKDWVSVFFGDSPVAELLAQVLESEGILVHVPDRNLRGTDMFGIGGPAQVYAEIFVPRRDEARARELLKVEPLGPEESEEFGDPDAS